MATKKDLTVLQGKTFEQIVRWETEPIAYAPITNIAKAAPAVITSAAHGIPDGWRVAVVSVKGMTQINAKNTPPKDSDYHVGDMDTNTVTLHDVNAADYTAYTSGGYLQYNTPHDLSGYTARMKIKDKAGGTVLASTEVGDAPLDTITTAVDNVLKTITVTIAASDTAAFTWTTGVYDLEIASGDPTPVVTLLSYGKVSVTKEVTA